MVLPQMVSPVVSVDERCGVEKVLHVAIKQLLQRCSIGPMLPS